jgi:hypothetical protein
MVASRVGTELKAQQTIKRKATPLIRFLTLVKVRNALGLIRLGMDDYTTSTDHDLELFGAVLKEANKTVESWGGELYFVYLPSWERYHRQASDGVGGPREQVLALVKRLDIPIIDMHPIFQAQPSQSALFTQHHLASSHYGLLGHRLVAETVADSLVNAGIPSHGSADNAVQVPISAERTSPAE